MTYAADTTAPVITAVAVTPDATGATITWSTSEAATSRVIFGTNPNVLNGSAAVGGVRTSHSITLDNLTPGTTYYFRAVSADVLGNSNSSPAAPAAPLDFRTLLIPALGCPCSIWDAAAMPAVASASDVDPIELGVKFRPSANGYVTALRFYKGASNGGTHVGSLWTSAGVLLGRVTFANESSTGWQQATLPQPVPLSANATYVVSYNASAGGYSIDSQYFEDGGVTNGPLQALGEGVSGGNGVFAAGGPAFPTQSNGSSNYWVDVVFVTTVPPRRPHP